MQQFPGAWQVPGKFIRLTTAQAAGVSFDLAAQVTIILVGLILSEGSGGIPGGGLVIALIFVQAFNLPL
ncbi:MAG: cation:dicarboxylase symporter family transporter [bacterium]